ncbi:hypothetical protein TP51_003034 [Salmonella enterica subsp. enterica]|nr:hypothetical protein [Salmonella enterica subsp. enterica serovar Rubislaw]EEA7823045.1 hypothetical protein [Salmonella enterica subsp. enterica serovar Miami]
MNEAHICSNCTDKPDNPGDSGDSGDTGGDTGNTDNPGGSGSTGGDATPPVKPDNPHVTPPVTPPENPFPENASLGQLRDLLTNCQRDAGRMPTADSEHYEPGPDYAYNARVRQCNAIYDRLVSQLPVGAMSAPSPDKQTFMTKSGAGALYSCKPNNLSPQEWADKGLLYPGPVVGSPWRNMPERKIPKCEVINAGTGDEHTQCDYDLSFNYGKDDGSGTTYCNSVYNAHVSGSGSDNPGDASPQAPGGGTGHAVPGQINCPSGLAPGTVCLGVPGAPEGEWAPCPVGSNPEYMCYGTGGTASPGQPGTGGTGTGDDGGLTGDDDKGGSMIFPALDAPELSLNPLWNIWPSARDFKLTLPEAQCPVFNIVVFDKTYKIDQFCTLLTPDIIAVIRTVCILVASVLSFIIVLRA